HTANTPAVADAAEARPSVAAKARLKAAVAGVRRVLASVGVVVPLVVLEHDLRGALLPLRRDQLLADGDRAAAVLAPLRERVLPLARDCAPGGVCVVLVTEIAPASSAAAAVLPELQGLALGPLAFAGGDDGLRAVARAAGYEAGGGPTVVLVSARHLMRRTGHGATALLLHEIGHALGLKHVPEPGRVMSVAGGSALATGFTDDELQRLRKAAEAQLGPVNSRASHRGGDGRRR
ncbi:MAG: hypothetical protein KC502_23715, partial [Myxococcales bacterium]|nr:hypothetical protein [Myxococcales bacterium]